MVVRQRGELQIGELIVLTEAGCLNEERILLLKEEKWIEICPGTAYYTPTLG